MQKKWQVGSLFGIPFFIDRSWFLILVLVTTTDANSPEVQRIAGSDAMALVFGLVMALLLFASVLLHELGHSLVAKAQGIEVKSITLFLFGGIASIERESKTPREAFSVAIAGPLVSFALFGFCWVVRHFTPEASILHFLAADMLRINLILALFNLIPGLPLDGGQMLKAIIWQGTGDRLRGVQYAAASGKFLGTLAIALGLLALLLANEFGGLWVSLLGWFILRNADAYERFTGLQNLLLSLKAKDAMGRDFRVVDAHLSLADFTNKYVVANPKPSQVIFASSEGRYRGLIRMAALQKIERSQWDKMEMKEIAIPLSEIPSVTEETNLATIICLLETLEDNFVTVLSPAGAVAGVIDRALIIQAIAKEYDMEIPAADIQKLRNERVYPKSFPIAQQLQAGLQAENQEKA
jgi:Zn-dependent protease